MADRTLISPLSPDALGVEQLPAEFGRFTLTGILGVGGMGRVFRAVLTGPSGFRKDVAVKVIRQRHRDDGPPIELDEEARIGGLLRHPNVVDVYDFGEVDGHPFISMELVRGLDLAQLAACATLEPAHIVQLGAAIAAGLAHAHDLTIDGRPAHLVHRDLKPSNVIVSRDGVTKVMDFGIAKLQGASGGTETGVAKGTPAYMSPEQAKAEPVDGRSDLWSLGAILYELAAGEPLLQGTTVIELMIQLLRVHDRLADPAALDAVEAKVPGLGTIVGRCLAERVEDRYARAADLEDALLALEATLPPAPSLRAVVRDVIDGGDGSGLLAVEARRTRRAPATATRDELSPHNLPELGTTFLGREDDLTRLEELFAGERLVTLLGPGGTGKTRLAVEFARRALPRFPRGGACFAPVTEARTAEGFLRAVGAAMGVPLTQGDEAVQIERIGAALGARGRMLLVLDNLEQVVSAAAGPLRAWLGAAPELAVLVTSRERLRIPREQVLELGPLPDGDAERLFVDRAAAARVGFALRDGDEAHVREIVRRLDRLPLAIELAAARVSILPVDRIASRLDQRFRLLRGRDRAADARQSTLEGAIAWSWDLLEPAEQHTLAWCSVFRGGFQLVHAEQMISLDGFDGAPWVLDTIEALREKSLLREVPGVDGSPRFAMYESIRAFASERLVELGDAEAAGRAHTEVFVQCGRELRARLFGGGAVAAMSEIEQEFENLLAVHERAETPEAVVEVTLTAGRHLFRRGPRALLNSLMETAWALRDQIPPKLKASLLVAHAQQVRIGSHPEDAARFSIEAVDLAYSLGEELLAAELSVHLAYDLISSDRAERTVAMLERAREDIRAAGQRSREGHVVSALATALGYAGRRREAMQMHREGLAIHDEVGSVRMVAVDAVAIAVHFALAGDLEEAEHWFLRAQSAFREARDVLSEQVVLSNMSHLNLELGRLEEAARTARRGLELSERLGRPAFQGLRSNLGAVHALTGDLDRAMAMFAEEETHRVGVAPPYARATFAAYRGATMALMGDDAAGLAGLELGVTEYRAGFSHRNAALTQALAACVAARRDDEARALELLAAANAGAEEHGGADLMALVGLAEAQIELLRARTAERSGDAGDAAMLRDLATARLDMLPPSLGVHLAFGVRLLEQSLGAG